MRRLTRPDLAALPAPAPGRDLAGLAARWGSAGLARLDTNEVPYGPLPGVPEAIGDLLGSVHRYPDMGAAALRDALARHAGVRADRVVTGCGSVALAEILVKATCVPGDEIVFAWRSFEAYPVIALGAGAIPVAVPTTAGHQHDLPAMAAAIGERTRLVFVCNPDNPTGTAVRARELNQFLDAVPADVLVVLDEAYRELVGDPRVPDGLRAFGHRPNVVVLRTLSKAWGLAGLRLGYLVAGPAVAADVRKVVTPFSSNLLAQAAALAALPRQDEMRRRCALVAAERARVTEALRALSVDVPTSQANFVWLPLGTGSGPFAAACESRGVLVRAFPTEGVRVTIGLPAENDRFLGAAEAALKESR